MSKEKCSTCPKKETCAMGQARLLQTLTENLPGFLYKFQLLPDKKERFVYASAGTRELFGLAPETVMSDVSTLRRIMHESDRRSFHSDIVESARTGTLFHREYRILHPQKGERWMETRSMPEAQADGSTIWHGATWDVTDRKRMELTLAAKEREFCSLMTNLTDNIARFDPKGNYLYINATHEKILGRTASDIIGRNIIDIAPWHTEVIGAIGRIAETEEKEIIVLQPVSADNSIAFNEVKLIPEKNDIGELVSVLTIGRDITQLRTTQAKLEHMTRHDILTGLPNRWHIKEYTDRAIAAARRRNEKIALLLVDLDNFKAVNDALGHVTGDLVLKEVAHRMTQSVREIDTVGRPGGDEFVIALSEIQSVDSVREFVSRLFRQFEGPVVIEKNRFFISMSIGIALFPDDGQNFDSLMKKTDLAMYAAKEAGRNTFSFFSGKMAHTVGDHLQMHADLKQALTENQLRLHFQPQVDTVSKQIVGAEALLRWEHPESGMIPPGRFIPVAEANGLIVPIGEWVLHEACRHAAQWPNRCGFPMTLAVNVSAIQFKQSDLKSTVLSALEQSGLSPELLELELTESILIQDTEQTLDTVNRLKAMGIRLSIDDFGTGYSSLSYLKRFNADTIKIDRSFVREMIRDPDDTVIVREIIRMAKNLDIGTVAEGVEDAQTLALLARLECDVIQGFFYSKPLAAKDFETFCRCHTSLSKKRLTQTCNEGNERNQEAFEQQF